MPNETNQKDLNTLISGCKEPAPFWVPNLIFLNPWILKIGNLFDELGSRIKNIFFLILQEPKQELGQGDQA